MSECPVSELARSGRFRRKQNECLLATLAPGINEDGIPRRTGVLTGNVNEPVPPYHALDSLATQDEGEDNLAELRKRGHHWNTAKRGGDRSIQAGGINAQDPDATGMTESGHETRVWKLSNKFCGLGLYIVGRGIIAVLGSHSGELGYLVRPAASLQIRSGGGGRLQS